MNTNVFKFTHYRTAFDELFQAHRKRLQGWTTAVLAERIRVQPSHITNVIKERSHFSSDQIFAIGLELGLASEETEYLDLLMEWERAEQPERKAKLQNQVRALRDSKLRAAKELKAAPTSLTSQQQENYYLDPNFELIHLFLGMKGAPLEIHEIASCWGLSIDYVSDIVAFLEKAGLVERRRQKWHVKPIHQMLPTTSPLCKPQQMLKRVRALEAVQKLSSEQVYSFSATVTMSEETKLRIQGRFLEFLKEVEQAVIESPSEGIYHFQFDLFPWLPSPKSKR